MSRLIVIYLLLSIVLIISNSLQASDYIFTEIAQYNSEQISNFIGNAGINNKGEVIFGIHMNSGDEIMYMGDGTSLTTLTDNSGPIDSFFWFSRMNDNGQFAYRAIMDDDSKSLFRHSLSGEELIRTTASGDFSAVPSINSNGEVAYLAHEESGSPNFLYQWNGSEELILDTSGSYSWLGGWPSVS